MIVATLAVFDKGLWELLEGGFKSGELSLAAKGFLPVALGAGSAVLVPFATVLVTRVAAVLGVGVAAFVLVDVRVGGLDLLAIVYALEYLSIYFSE